MKDLRDLSGPWLGFWIQGKQRGAMRLRLFFAGENVSGDGRDEIGSFSISGRYLPSTEAVVFVKTYSTHRIEYEGKWDGTMIFGQWIYRSRIKWLGDKGEFEIWPEPEEESVERQLEFVEEPTTVPA